MPVDRRLVTLTAADGEEHDALLEIDLRAARGRTRATGRRTALVHVHGIMGNFLVGTLRFYPAPLARAGFPVLVLETPAGDRHPGGKAADLIASRCLGSDSGGAVRPAQSRLGGPRAIGGHRT
jgi:hypothetical protein